MWVNQPSAGTHWLNVGFRVVRRKTCSMRVAVPRTGGHRPQDRLCCRYLPLLPWYVSTLRVSLKFFSVLANDESEVVSLWTSRSEYTDGTGVLREFMFGAVAAIGCMYNIGMRSEDGLTCSFLQHDVATRRPNFESCH